MSSLAQATGITPLLSLKIQQETDVVTARRRARRIAELLGFDRQDQTRTATAISEIARNAYQYAGGGCVDFAVDLLARPQMLWMTVSDRGPGIPDLDAALGGTYISGTGMGIGLAGASRLMDDFHVDSSPANGTLVRLGKAIPAGAKPLDVAALGAISAALAEQRETPLGKELERQNREVLQILEALRLREEEIARLQEEMSRLSLELEETNRGVVALYAELDEKAVELRRAAEMKSRFLSHVTHEFRTPVNSMLALTRLLLQHTDGELAPEQEKQVAYIRDAAQQLAEMVNDLLDLSKVESGKTEIRLARIDVGQLFGATRALMRPLVQNERVSLIFEEPPPGLTLETDESKLGQILRNLISNALKFTEEGEVRVAVKLSPSRDSIMFAVKDTGIGIDPRDHERIFQEFLQVEHPLQRHVKGTGLGLSLSRKLAELLDGAISVESAIGAGSTFTLKLPYHSHSAQPESGEAPFCRREFSKSILVVDDDATTRYLVHQLFRGTEYSLIESSGAEAAERARFDRPALIVLDLMMPDRSGYEILDELKADDSTKDIPVVIHTSKLLTEGDYARLAQRHVAVLPKGPDGRRPALAAIRELLGEPDLFASEPEFHQ
ncbi:MAG TPA: ATP-binding protein [Bryobacteraceae bacterium]